MKGLRVVHLIALIVLLLAAAPAGAMDLSGTVLFVNDGDTCRILLEGKEQKVRLYGIDAPEIGRRGQPGQPHGEEARQALKRKIHGKQVEVEVVDVDKNRRLVALIRLGRRDINREMVAEGRAWAYRQYLHTPYASSYIGAETRARKEKRGLWQEANPQPPWEFRLRQRLGRR